MTTSSSSHTRCFLVASLVVLSTGVCFTEAFTTASSMLQHHPSLLSSSSSSSRTPSQQPQQQSRLYYAPRSSFDSSEQQPKRGPGRPRKNPATPSGTASKKKSTATKSSSSSNNNQSSRSSSDSATATSTKNRVLRVRSSAAAATKANAENSALNSATRRIKKRNPNQPKPQYFDLLEHDLLTKKEEQTLSLQLRRSVQSQKAMNDWITANKARLEDIYAASESAPPPTQEDEDDEEEDDDDDYSYLYGSIDSVVEDEEDNFEESDLFNELMYGTSSGQAVEQYLAKGDDSEELFYQDGTAFFEGGDNVDVVSAATDELLSASSSKPKSQPAQQPKAKSVDPLSSSWVDDLLLQSNDKSTSWLTDDDVKQALDLAGGRAELRTILLEGALAREKLISCNFKLAVSIAKKWAGEIPGGDASSSIVNVYGASSSSSRPGLDDAIHEGVMGLAEAADRFDPDQGFRFSTYATIWCTNKIRRAFYRESSQGMRLPDQYYEIKRKYINQVRHYMNSEGGEVPAMHVLANDLGVTEERLTKIVRLARPLLSTDASITRFAGNGAGNAGSSNENTGYTLSTLLESEDPGPEHYVERSFLRQCLENALAMECTPGERDIIRLRHGLDDGEPKTAHEVAAIFGGRLTVPAIRGMEQRAIKKLGSPFAVHTHKLTAYLDFAGIDMDYSELMEYSY